MDNHESASMDHIIKKYDSEIDYWLQFNDNAANKLMEQAIADNDANILPILADALEDAGCNLTELLVHLRTHVHSYFDHRSCYAVRILRKNP